MRALVHSFIHAFIHSFTHFLHNVCEGLVRTRQEQRQYADKTYEDLLETNEPAVRRLKNTVLRAIIIKQLNPRDDTSIYHIFERLNTGGTPLTGQEIRNCIYHGPFNDLLHELNRLSEWRELFGKDTEDKRQRDIELILRFFALSEEAAKYEKPMKDFLSRFMSNNRKASALQLDALRTTFVDTTNRIKSALGEKPFRLGKGLNAALFDSIFVAFASHSKTPAGIKKKYERLLKDETFTSLVTASTTDEDAVAKRLRMANQKLFGTNRK